MGTSQPPAGTVTATQQVLMAAAGRGDHRALVHGWPERQYSYRELAATVQAAAAGLAWRGLQPRDVVGVYVPDAGCHVLATHAIRAAGGIPSLVSHALTVPDIAGQLADCGARMLLTAPPLAAAGLAAADRSWVRQVISFAEAAGAIQFGALLQSGSLPPPAGRADEPALLPYARSLDGAVSPAPVSHAELAAQLHRLDAEARIGEDDVVVAAPPSGDGAAYTALLDHALLRGATIVAVQSADAAEIGRVSGACQGTAVIAPGGMEITALQRLRVLAVVS